jgi:hypothetical protein
MDPLLGQNRFWARTASVAGLWSFFPMGALGDFMQYF